MWTTLVSDLETPVSAFLKIADERPMSFLLESVEGGAVRGRYSIIGLEPDVVWRTVAGPRRDQSRGAPDQPDAFAAVQRTAAGGIARIPCRKPDRIARSPAADVGRHFRLSRLRHGAADGGTAEPNPDPIGIPDAVMVRPTIVVVFDAVKDAITVVTPVRPESGASRRYRLRPRRRAPFGGGRRAGRAARHMPAERQGAACSPSGHHPTPRPPNTSGW